MTVLASNQPYQRVDDGVGAGLVTGAILGKMAHGAVGMGLGYKAIQASGGIDALTERTTRDMERFQRMTKTPKQQMFAGIRVADRAARKAIDSMDDGLLKNVARTGYGSTKRAMISGGLSVLAGSILGASIDAMND